MSDAARIERHLEVVLTGADGASGAPGLSAAVRHAVFPGGARVRPRFCLAVAAACGAAHAPGALSVAAAIELLHCASLVHDDLPCFDDAGMRRGRPAVHRAFGERLAVLAGDALIVLAFESIANDASCPPERRIALLATLAASAGMPGGIVSGQAWECEARVVLSDYQRAKTGALFVAAAVAGAQAAGADPAPWRRVGEALGEAYQLADDIRDVIGSAEELGKPTGRDAALGRPNAVERVGLGAARARMHSLLTLAETEVPDCPGAGELRACCHEVMQVRSLAERSRPAA